MRRRRIFASHLGRCCAIERLDPRWVLSAPPLPVIPATIFNITSYGASTGSANNATAIQNAINATSSAGGGTVEIPAGTWMSGPISLLSKINLQVDAGATLKALAMANYPNNTSPANFITISAKNNVEISGSGTIDGNGQDWWTAYIANSNIGRPRLINGSQSGGVANDRIWIRNVTLQNSPQFDCALSGSNNVTIDGITIFNPTQNGSNISPNTDGIDMGGNHWLIQNCTIDTGDDNIVAKPGSTASSDMTVTNCVFKHGHGMSIGGQTNLGLNGLTVTNCTFDGTTTGIRMKASRIEGGLVTNCTYSNITMYNVQYPININSYYRDGTIPKSTEVTDTAQAITSTTPYWQNVSISNLTSTWDSGRPSYYSGAFGNSYTGVLWGLPEAPLVNIALSNVKISGAKYGVDIDHAHNVSFDSQCSFTNSSGANIISAANNSTPPVDATIVKSGWMDTDIGAPTPASTTLYNPNTDTQSMLIGGAGFTGTSDQFNLESQDVSGNGLISAKVATLATTNANARAGVMMRDGTATGAAFVAALEQTNKQLALLYRATSGATVQIGSPVGDTTNAKYVKLTRVGSTFTAWYSTNGTSWSQIGSPVSITMGTSIKAGLATTSANTASASSASFTGATVVIDNTSPTIVGRAYLYSSALNKVSFSFSEDVSASLSANSLSVIRNSDNASIAVTGMNYDSGTNTAIFTLATPLLDGDYLATLSASTSDPVGNAISGSNSSLPFFVLAGDVNRDGVVNALDFNALAANFGGAGSFSQGDLDHSGTITTADFTILAADFGAQVPAPAAPMASLFSSVTLADKHPDPLSLAGNDASGLL